MRVARWQVRALLGTFICVRNPSDTLNAGRPDHFLRFFVCANAQPISISIDNFISDHIMALCPMDKALAFGTADFRIESFRGRPD